MSISVDRGADESKAFTYYLKYLEDEGYITPPMKDWVGLIREHGNKSTHKIEAPDRQRAESTFMFTAELLRIIYEMDDLAQRYLPEEEKDKEDKEEVQIDAG